MSKPAPTPNIHPGCKVKIIDETKNPPQWKTVGTCFDAPNPIRAMMKKFGLKGAWIFGIEKRYVTF